MLSEIKVGDYLGDVYKSAVQGIAIYKGNLKQVKQIIKTSQGLIYKVDEGFDYDSKATGFLAEDYGKEFVRVSQEDVKVGDKILVNFLLRQLNGITRQQSLVVEVDKLYFNGFSVGEGLMLFFSEEGTSWEKVE